ncbi:hypothetical protein G5714_007276 [Onychostoma macrolepis]|uniref:ILEI/PANDER domain-containing protein n=1 Tax=Onychostoma macrolepis TaxID=369639 RepID=A0A7J6CZW0_9TELE|nr:hypothetical protein G5714_007276 [Onychostoma macrolepis]
MRLKDLVYVLTTMLIILMWCFSINWSKLQEAAKRICYVHDDVNDSVTDCDNPGKLHFMLISGRDGDGAYWCACSTVFFREPVYFFWAGLFKPHFGCCPHKHCPINYFPFHIHSGVANVVAAKICETGEVLRNKNFDLESRGPEELLVYLKTLKPGNIVLVASHIDPTPKLTDEIRDIFTALGSTMVKSLKPRDSWVFAGAYGIKEASSFEKLIQNHMRSNAYEDWPEMGEIIGCFPRIFETE